ncbi:MAG: DNA gyrase modulator, partial [Candidatus Bathyarchaeia archaeon]
MRLDDIPLYIVDLAKRLGATDAAAKLTESRRVMIRFSNNEVTVSKVFLESSIDVFVMIEKHRAATTISALSARNIKKSVENLVKIAKSTPPADIYAPLPQGPFTYNSELIKAPKISLNPDRLTLYVESAVKHALEKGAKRAAGTLDAHRSRITLATSGDVYASQEKSGIEISVRAFVSELATGHA